MKVFGRICDCIHKLEGNNTTLGDIYWTIKGLDEHVKHVTKVSFTDFLQEDENMTDPLHCEVYEEISLRLHQYWEDRKNFGWHDVIIADAMLDPEYYDRSLQIGLQERRKGERVMRNVLGDSNDGPELQH